MATYIIGGGTSITYITGSSLHSGDIMLVSSGGTADNITFLNGASGTIYSDGIISSAKVSSGGFLGVDGGFASKTTISAGSMVVSSGSIDVTSVHKTTKSGGSGGSVVSSSFSGYLKIDSLGSAASTFLHDFTRMDVYGSADSTVVSSGGAVFVYNLASVTNTSARAGAFINGFSIGTAQSYANGLLIDHATVKQSDAFLYSGQSATDTTVESRTMTISSGAVAVNTTINNGTVNFNSGAAVSGVKINGGEFNANSGTVTSDITLVNGQVDISGGKVQGLLMSGGRFYLNSGSLQSDIRILNGSLTLATFASASNITNSGNLLVYAMAYSGYPTTFVSGTTNFGSMTVSANYSLSIASARDTVNQNNGVLRIYGVSRGSAYAINTVNYGSMYVGVDDYVLYAGAASKTSNYGKMFVEAGKINETDIYANGSLTVSSGGTATSTTVSSGGSMWAYGSAASTTVLPGGWISGSGNMNSTVLSSGAVFNGFTVLQSQFWSSGVQLVNAVLPEGVDGNLYFGHSGSKLAVAGKLSVAYATLNSVTVSNGARVVVSNGTLSDFTVQDGGFMEFSGTDNNIAGPLTMAKDAVISVSSKSQLNLRLDQRLPSDGYLISDYSRFEGDISIKLTVDAGMDPGEYKLAQGVSDDFSQAVYLLDPDGEYYLEDPITVNSDPVPKDHMTFQLKLEDGNLTLTTTGNNGPGVLSVSADPLTPTNQTVTVTAKFNDLATKHEYSFTNSEKEDDWFTLDSSDSVVLTENATVFFRGQDSQGTKSRVVSYTVDWIDPSLVTVTADITVPTNQNVTLTAYYSAASVGKQYSFDNSKWQDYTAAITVSSNCTVYFRGLDAAGSVVAEGIYEVTNIDKIPPTAPTVSADITEPTNGNVTLTAVYSPDSELKEFSYDNEKWVVYAAPVVMEENGTVYFRGADAAGNISPVISYIVSNIDRTLPDTPVVTADITTLTNKDVTLTAVYGSGTAERQYSMDGGTTWQTYESPVVLKSNATVYFRALNAAGKSSATVRYKVDYIDKTAPDQPKVTADITVPTNRNVTLTAVYSSDSAVREYSLDGGQTWRIYGAPVVVQENGTVYFRAMDAAGNICEPVSYSVTNIDKTVPDAPVVTADITELTDQPVTLTAVYSSDSALKQYSTDGTNWMVYTEPLTFDVNTTVYFRGLNSTGTASETVTYRISNIDKSVPDAPTVSGYPTEKTDQEVTLTASFSPNSFVKEYSVDGNYWELYTEAVVIGENMTVYFRASNANGVSPVTSYVVDNIDRKVSPDDPVLVYSSGTLSKSGKVLTGVQLVRDGNDRLYVSGGGSAVNPLVNTTGHAMVFSGGYAHRAVLNSGGRLSVSSGGLADSTTVNANGRLYVYRGGSAVSATVNSVGAAFVSGGGLLNTATVNSLGRVYLYGSARDLSVSGGLVAVSSGGSVLGATVGAMGQIKVFSGGDVTSATLNNAAELIVSGGGAASRTVVNGGNMLVRSGASAANVSAGSGAVVTVEDGGRIAGISAGSAGKVFIQSGAVAEGLISLASGTLFEVADGGIVNIDLTTVKPGSNAFLFNPGRITGAPAFTVTVLDDQKTGIYKLAQGISGFDPVITVQSSGEKFVDLVIGESEKYGDYIYTLSTLSDFLRLSIEKYPERDIRVLSVTAEPEDWTAGAVSVSAVFTEDATIREYSLDNENWLLYAAPVELDENGTVYFRGTDGYVYSDVVSCTVDWIDKIPPVIDSIEYDQSDWTAGNVTVTVKSSDEGSGISAVLYSFNGGEWTEFEGSFEITENGSFQVKAVDKAGNETPSDFLPVGNIDKTGPSINSVSGYDVWDNNIVVVSADISDSQSGLAKTWYSFDGAPWTEFNGSFALTACGPFQLKAVDNVGNETVSGIYNVTDTIAPVIESISFDPDWTVGPVTISAVVSDHESGVAATYYTFNGTPWTLFDGSFSVADNGPFMIKVVDKAGNQTLSKVINVKSIDKIAPSIDSVTGYDVWDSNRVTVTAAVSDNRSGVAGTWYSFNGGEWTGFDGSFTLSECGTFQVRAADNAGNETLSEVFSVVDTAAPVIESITGYNVWHDGMVTVQVNAVDNESGIAATYYTFNGTPWIKFDGSFDLPKDGPFMVKAVDKAGNQTLSKVLNAVDKTAPLIESVTGYDVWENNQVTVSVTASDAETGLDKMYYTFNGAPWTEFDGSFTLSECGPFMVKVTDRAGNASLSSVYNVVDTAAPVIESISGYDVWSNDSVTVSVAAADYETGLAATYYTFNGTPWIEFDGSFVLTDNGPFQIKAVDKAGNQTLSKVLNVKVIGTDVTPPSIDSISGYDVWNANTVTVSVSVSDTQSGVAATYYTFNGTPWTLFDGSFELTSCGPFMIKAVDNVGNETLSKVINVKDTVAPVIDSITGYDVWDAGTVTVQVAASDHESGLAATYYTFSGTPWTLFDGSFELTSCGPFQIKAVDKAGNQTLSKVINVKDKIAPVIESITGYDGWSTDTATISVEVSDNESGIAAVYYQLSGGDWTEFTGSFDVTENGTFQIKAVDKAGNVTVSDPIEITAFTPDTVAPVIDSVTGYDVWSETSVTISVTASDDRSGVDKTYYTFNGTPWIEFDGSFTVTQNGPFMVKVVDRAGNETLSPVRNVKCIHPDTTAPVIDAITGYNDWDRNKVTVTVEATDTESGVGKMYYTFNGTPWTEFDGSFELTSCGPFMVKVADNSGNTTMSKVLNVVDKIAPVIGTISGNDAKGASSATVFAEVSDNESGIAATYYTFNGSPWIKYDDSFTVTENGPFMIKAVDKAGNETWTHCQNVKNIVKSNSDSAALAGEELESWNDASSLLGRELAAAADLSALSGDDLLSGIGGGLGLETAADFAPVDADLLKFGRSGNALTAMIA